MEFYKLPDKFGDYSLDYCTEIEGYSYRIDFAYKGEEGIYYNGNISFRDKEYTADKHYINNHSNAFTKEDIPMLIAMARNSIVNQFPFKTEAGDIICLAIENDWLEELGISILKSDSTAKYYSFKDGNLYIDDTPIDILNFCKLYKLKDDTYGYGIQPPKDTKLKFVTSKNLVFGCKSKYLKEMLPYLPLEDTFHCMEIPNESTHIDDCLGEAREMYSVPMYEVIRYEESLDFYNSLFITYKVAPIGTEKKKSQSKGD